MVYLATLLVTLELYLILTLSLNLLTGYTGLVSLCHAAFYGVGAYSAALLMKLAGWDFPAAVGGAMLLTMCLGAVVALPSLRLRDDYFIVATLAFQTICYRTIYNWDGLTGGARALPDIPPPRFWGVEVPPESPWFLALSTVCCLAVVLVMWRLKASPYGLALRALRDDEEALAALGRSPAAFKVTAFLTGSACAALAGALLACKLGTLDPNQFAITESVLVLTALIVGGSGNLLGPMVGAAVVVVAPEPLRHLGAEWSAVVGEVRQILFGLLLIVLLRVRPQGLAGDYRFE